MEKFCEFTYASKYKQNKYSTWKPNIKYLEIKHKIKRK